MSRLLRPLIRHGLRRGFRQGVLEGNRAWIVVGGVALLAHLGGRAIGREAEVVFSEPLRPGQTFRITHQPRR